MAAEFFFPGHHRFVDEAAKAKDVPPHEVAGAKSHPNLIAISNQLHQLTNMARDFADRQARRLPADDIRVPAASILAKCREKIVELEVAHVAAVAMMEHAEEMFTDEALTPKPYEPPPRAPEPEAAPAEDESEWVQVPEDEDVDEALEEIDAGEATQGGEAKAKGRRRAKK